MVSAGGIKRVRNCPPGIVFGNGRIEADEIDIDTKYAGRIAEMLADEGDMVKAGQIVARMDTQDLNASLKKSQAQVRQAQKAIDEANANIVQQTDPLARDRFWELLFDLSRSQGVTIFVSTHFMNEAGRCDRISLMDSGRVLATDTPGNLIGARGVTTLEDAFIDFLENEAARTPEAGVGSSTPLKGTSRALTLVSQQTTSPQRFSFQRLFAYTIRETLELFRDPIRLGFALFGTALSTPDFGSSRINISGSWTIATASESRWRIPSGRSEVT